MAITLNSALMAAAETKKLGWVKSLVGNGACVNAQTSWGMTPLGVAAMRGRKEIVEFLLSAGADPRISTRVQIGKYLQGSRPSDLCRDPDVKAVLLCAEGRWRGRTIGMVPQLDPCPRVMGA